MTTPQGKGWAGDVWGGLAAMLVALPSAIAFGVAAYTPLGGAYIAYGAMAGVLGTVAMGLVTPALGGAPRLITAPCAPAAAVLTSLAAGLLTAQTQGGAPPAPERILFALTLVALLSALVQLLLGAVGSGKLIKFIPYPVVAGYLSGVGVLIFLSQVPKLLGLPKGAPVGQGLLDPSLWQWAGIVVGLVTIVGMALAPRLTKVLPAPIVGLMAGMTVYFAIGVVRPELWQLAGNPLLIGPITLDWNALASGARERWGAMGQLRMGDLAALVVPALTLSVLLSIDTLKTCVVVDALTRTRHNSNRELLAQGLGNLASALAGGMPGAGTMGATLVSVNSGATSRLAGVLEGVFALTALLVLGQLIGWVPIAALAGILIVVAFKMFDWHTFALLRQRATLLDFCVIFSVVATAVAFNLIAAAGVGVAMAVVLFLREQVRGSVIRRKLHGGDLSSKHKRLPEEREILAEEGRGAVICELQGNLFFGTTDQLFTKLEPDLGVCRYLILELRRVQSVDFTAIHMLEQIEAILRDRGAQLLFADVPASLPTGRDLREYFAQVGLVQEQDELKMFPTLDHALEWVEERILEERLEGRGREDRPLELHEIQLLHGLKEERMLELMQSSVEERAYAAGETIFHLGDEGDEICLIRRGVVRVVLPLENGEGITLALFGRGNFFGDMAFLDRGKRSTDVVADSPTELFIISRERFDELAKEHPKLGHKVFARLAKSLAIRLRYTNAELSAVKEF